MQKIPVTIVTGFLGSGKSTILSEILKDPAFHDTAVIVNEFGEVGLDDFLVVSSDEQIVEMTTGCLCCTVRGDITESLLSLWEKRDKGNIPQFSRITIETTGMADPAPVIHTLVTEPRIMKRFDLHGVITTLDGVNGLHTLDGFKECQKQIALADQIILTKTDMGIDEAALHDLNVQCRKLNPSAPILDKNTDRFDLATVFDHTSQSHDIEKWLGIKKNSHHHHDHHHSNIQTFSMSFDNPISQSAFVLAMQLLISSHGENLLRIKGIVCLQENPDKPVILHGVQHVFHEPTELESWPSDDRRTRLVFITRNLDKASLTSYFNNWLDGSHQDMIEGLLQTP